MVSVGVVFQNKKIDIINQIPARKITAISKGTTSRNCVFNGNTGIQNYDKFDEIVFDEILGVTFLVDADFDVDYYIEIIGLHNPMKYIVDKTCIIEGRLIYENNLHFESVQIAIKKDCVLIGFPSILEGF